MRPYETAGARDAARIVRRFLFGYLVARALLVVVPVLVVVGGFALLVWLT